MSVAVSKRQTWESILGRFYRILYIRLCRKLIFLGEINIHVKYQLLLHLNTNTGE